MNPVSISTLDELKRFAESVADRKDSRALLLLNGEMGAGKTQFTKFLLEALGSSDVVSPSFAIHNSYEVRGREIHHFDLFRLESADDLESTGFWDLFDLDSAWIIIEWAEKLNEFDLRKALPQSWPTLELNFKVHEDGRRTVTPH